MLWHTVLSRHTPDVTITTVSSLRRFFHLGLRGANVTTPQSRRAIDVTPPCHAVMRKSMPPPARWLRRAGATANLQSGRKISGQLGAPGAIRPRRSRLSAGKARRDEYDQAGAERWLVRLKSGMDVASLSISPCGIEAAQKIYFVWRLNCLSTQQPSAMIQWS